MESREFYGGIAFDAYEVLGAHPAGQRPGWDFCVFAPHARQVQVVGDWNGWDLYRAAALTRCGDGLWRVRVPRARAGQLYKYNILGADGVWRLRADPYAFAFEPLPGTASRLTASEFVFTDDAWMARRGPGPDAPVSIYELYAGGWRRHPDGRYYSWTELAEALVPWMTQQGYTHLELLPPAEYPFDGSWGYHGVGYFAPSARFGTPDQFRGMVNALHQAGIGVLVDLVPVHFAVDDGFLARFDGEPLYEPPGDAARSPWGSLEFDLERGEVRSFLLSAASFWLYRCHCDGLRVDAVGHALYRPDGGWRAAEFFKTLTAGLHARCPGATLIAEDSAGCLNATRPTREGGLGFDYKWNLGWAHALLSYFSLPFNARPAAFSGLAAGMDGFWGEHWITAFSHDENTWDTGTVLGRMYGGYDQQFAQARLVYLIQTLLPGKKLDFMGGELGHYRSFDAFRALDWGLLQYPSHADFARYRAALCALYRTHPALYGQEYDNRCFRWVARQDARYGVLGWLRMSGGEVLLCLANTGPAPLPAYRVCLRSLCRELRLLPVFSTLPGPPAGDAATAEGWATVSLKGFQGAVFRLV